MRKYLVASFGYVALIFAPQPVAAVIVTVTYSGAVERAHDKTGLFGQPTSDLRGSYVATYVYGSRDIVRYPGLNSLTGGTGSFGSKPSPTVSASFTLNGKTISINGDFSSQYFAYNNGSFSQQSHFAEDKNTQNGIIQEFVISSSLYDSFHPSLPSTLDKVFSYDVGSRQLVYGDYFEFYQSDLNGNNVTLDTYGHLHPQSLRYTVSDVPEPATWATSLFGFLSIGGVLRRKRTGVLRSLMDAQAS